MKLIIIALVSFFCGLFVSTIYLSEEINSHNKAFNEVLDATQSYASKLKAQRSIDKLKSDVDILGNLAAREQNGTPIRVMMTDMANKTKNDVEKLSSSITGMEDPKLKEQAINLIQEANKVIDEVEFYYK
ncbi:hypothetical protein Tel_01535 [Candidatus Tenderia electrophaga]|jgi:hypothetical protein|uniref:Uncharacterized protein n=1 Tax=Candidatus Tenderia electrophaga TaxID=1748243 RepID=A0A0S2T9W7_9GAMM|nr:hypothetical protein Tel_01535 [Candidatus Tenderia electrophaga]